MARTRTIASPTGSPRRKLIRLALAAALGAALSVTATSPAVAAKSKKNREVGYRIEYSGGGMFTFHEHRAVPGLTGDESIDLEFTFSGDLGVVTFRNGAPLNVNAGDRTEGLVGGEHRAWYQYEDGSSWQGQCSITPGDDLATGLTTFGETDPLLASLDGEVSLYLHPFDRLDAVMTCDDRSTAAFGFDNLPLVAGEPGSGRFDMPFTLPAEAVGKGYIEQLIPERAYTGDRCPGPSQGGKILACKLTWRGKITFRKQWQRRVPAKGRGTGAPAAPVTGPVGVDGDFLASLSAKNASLAPDARSVTAQVACRTACTGAVIVEPNARKLFTLGAGGSRRVVVRLGPAARRAVRRDGAARVQVVGVSENRTDRKTVELPLRGR